jgi:membrane protease YdiL (CAAX protease family)
MTHLRGLFAGRTALIQFLTLLVSVLTGLILYWIAGLFFTQTALSETTGGLRFLQFVSELCLLFLPALAVACLCSRRPSHYLSIRKLSDPPVWAGVVVSMFLLSPAITLSGFLNSRLQLPAFMAPVEQWMRAREETVGRLLETLFAGNDPSSLLLNLAVVAAAAALAEEFFFRGALQRILEQRVSGHHAVIWITAIIFSLVHLQFYGFVPRMLLGAYLGYLLYWSKCIWLPVLAHFTNNAMAVIGMSSLHLKENSFVTGEIPSSGILSFSVAALVCLCLFFSCVRYLRRRLRCFS